MGLAPLHTKVVQEVQAHGVGGEELWPAIGGS